MKYILAVIVILVITTIVYRHYHWDLQTSQQQALVQDCLNYGDQKFCNCFIDKLNTKIPAQAEVRTLLQDRQLIVNNKVLLETAKECY